MTLIKLQKELHCEGPRVCVHNTIELDVHGDSVYSTYSTYDADRKAHAEHMGVSHMDHMIGHNHSLGDGSGVIMSMFQMFDDGTMFMSTNPALINPLLALEFCVKMQPHHQEAVDTGDVMYKFAVDGGVGHLGFHVSYWQGVEIARQHDIGVALINYINSSNEYPQKLKDLLNTYVVEYKRVRAGTGTHSYDKDSDSYVEGGVKDYVTEQAFNTATQQLENKRFLKYWPEYKKMIGDQFYDYTYGPTDLWPYAEVKWLRDMHDQNVGGHMMISSMLKNMNKLVHPDDTDEMFAMEYIVNRDTYTPALFASSTVVMADTVDSIIPGSPSFHETVSREYKIYFGEVPYLLAEINRIGVSSRMTYNASPFNGSEAESSTMSHDDHMMMH